MARRGRQVAGPDAEVKVETTADEVAAADTVVVAEEVVAEEDAIIEAAVATDGIIAVPSRRGRSPGRTHRYHTT